MNTKTIATALIMCVSVVLAEERDEVRYTEAAKKTAEQLRKRIQAEATALTNHPWAGQYFYGDGLGVNVTLLLAPSAGYVFEWHGCLGLYDRNYGSVAAADGKIRLAFTYKNKREGFEGIAEEFFPVAWGERRYLIPTDDVIGFCNNVNDGTEPRNYLYGSYLLRDGDEKKAVSGSPALPEKYRSYLLAKPITVEIISVNSVATRPGASEWKMKETIVTLDAGKDKGLWKGMKMMVVKPANVFQLAVITEIKDSTSQAVVTQFIEEESEPKKGWKLSTRFRWAKERHTTIP